jgi:hypothetical protein
MGARKWHQEEGKCPHESHGNIIDARQCGFDSHDIRGLNVRSVGECREPQRFNFGANPRGENCVGAVKGQNRETTTKDNNSNRTRGTSG